VHSVHPFQRDAMDLGHDGLTQPPPPSGRVRDEQRPLKRIDKDKMILAKK
jgi:hypothetical protein